MVQAEIDSSPVECDACENIEMASTFRIKLKSLDIHLCRDCAQDLGESLVDLAGGS